MKPPVRQVKKRPPGLLCSTCARRVLGLPSDQTPAAAEPNLKIFQLKLRDWLGVERIELRPCLSVCPSEGMTVERRGKTLVLDRATIDLVNRQFDPTRQLSFLEDSDSRDQEPS